MGLFDRLFGKSKAQTGSREAPASRQGSPLSAGAPAAPTPARDMPRIVLALSGADLKKGLLLNDIRYGDSPDAVKQKELFPLTNQGTENGKPWLIFMKSFTHLGAQLIYNFDSDDGLLDQASVQADFNFREDADRWYADYLRHLTEQFGDPIDGNLMKIKMLLTTRAMTNLIIASNIHQKWYGLEAKRDRFDTWIVPVEGGKVKIDLLTLVKKGKDGKEAVTLFLSYKQIPAALLDAFSLPQPGA